MALTLEQKKQVVAEVAEVAASSLSVVASEYRGLTVKQVTDFRKMAREKGVVVRVVKNSLARRALTGTDYECMSSGLVGPLILAFSQEDLGSAARVVKDFSKENDAMKVAMIAVGSELHGPEALAQVAALPTRDEALSMLLGTLQAPVAKLARTLNEVPGKLARTLTAVKEAKETA